MLTEEQRTAMQELKQIDDFMRDPMTGEFFSSVCDQPSTYERVKRLIFDFDSSWSDEVDARQRDRKRLRRVLGMAKQHRSWHLAWKVTAEYLFDLLNAGYEREDKLADERDELQRRLEEAQQHGAQMAVDLLNIGLRLDEAREVLRAVEAVELWDPGDGEWYVGCARCGAESEKDAHYDDCKLAAALAGGEEG